MSITEQKIINKIKSNPVLNEQYIDLPIPSPYFANKDSIKAIVLGADPSNFSGENKTTIALKTLFDLPACAPPAFNFVPAHRSAFRYAGVRAGKASSYANASADRSAGRFAVFA